MEHRLHIYTICLTLWVGAGPLYHHMTHQDGESPCSLLDSFLHTDAKYACFAFVEEAMHVIERVPANHQEYQTYSLLCYHHNIIIVRHFDFLCHNFVFTSLILPTRANIVSKFKRSAPTFRKFLCSCRFRIRWKMRQKHRKKNSKKKQGILSRFCRISYKTPLSVWRKVQPSPKVHPCHLYSTSERSE